MLYRHSALGASDLETLVALGELTELKQADAELLEKMARLTERDQQTVHGLIDLLLRQRSTGG